MADCKLSIEVHGADEHGDAWVEPGGLVDATVHVTVTGTGAVQCDALKLSYAWRTHGRGNQTKGRAKVVRLFSGTWSAGEYAYPTTIRLPRRPVTYHGDNLNVDWYLMARADVPWAIDPKAEATVLMVDESKPEPYEPPPRAPVDTVHMKGSYTGCLFPSVAAIAGAVAAYLYGYRYPAAAVALVAVVLILLSLRDRRSARRLGLVGFGIWPREVTPGSEVHAFVEVEPEEDLSVEAFHIEVLATEETVSGSGTSETTYTEVVERLKHRIRSASRISPARGVHEEATFTLPLHGPASFEIGRHSLLWTVCLTIKVRGGSELTHSVPLVVGGRIESVDVEE